jgi:hypothetical protein
MGMIKREDTYHAPTESQLINEAIGLIIKILTQSPAGGYVCGVT